MFTFGSTLHGFSFCLLNTAEWCPYALAVEKTLYPLSESTTTEESNEAEAAPSSESIVEEKGQEEVSTESSEVEVAEEATEETVDDSTPQADEGSQDAPAE